MDNDAGDVRVVVDTRIHKEAEKAAQLVSGVAHLVPVEPMEGAGIGTYRIFKGKRD